MSAKVWTFVVAATIALMFLPPDPQPSNYSISTLLDSSNNKLVVRVMGEPKEAEPYILVRGFHGPREPVAGVATSTQWTDNISGCTFGDAGWGCWSNTSPVTFTIDLAESACDSQVPIFSNIGVSELARPRDYCGPQSQGGVHLEAFTPRGEVILGQQFTTYVTVNTTDGGPTATSFNIPLQPGLEVVYSVVTNGECVPGPEYLTCYIDFTSAKVAIATIVHKTSLGAGTCRRAYVPVYGEGTNSIVVIGVAGSKCGYLPYWRN